MKKLPNKYHNNRFDQRFDYHLEESDFDYLKDEFVAVKDSLGFTLTSIKKPKLSIHIGAYDIKYDNDIAERRMMIAVERVTLPISLLVSYHCQSLEYLSLIPKTTENLYKLINEFKYNGIGNVKKEEIIDFLVAQSK